MFTQDPRTNYAPFSATPAYGFGYGATGFANSYNPNFQGLYGHPGFGPSMISGAYLPQYDVSQIAACMGEIRNNLLALNELVRGEILKRTASEMYSQGFAHQAPTAIPYGPFGHNISPLRVRENDSHIFWEIYLPQLAMGDVDVEVSGNRIICRTRVPVAPVGRWWATSQIPRGFELFELADGRVEFNWIAPFAFQAKEVEGTWREGFLCVCIPKAEVAPRQAVKVVKDSSNSRRAANDMNS